MNPRLLARLLLLSVLVLHVAPARLRFGPEISFDTGAAASLTQLGAERLDLVAERASRSVEMSRTRQVRPAPGPLTGWFGEGRRGHMHTGLDINGETGDPVVAAAYGVVVHAGPAVKGYSGYGNMVTIDHGAFETVYAHLSRVDVAVGRIVRAGDGIGAIGTTGSVTGSHLHFETRVGGEPVDPKSVMPLFR